MQNHIIARPTDPGLEPCAVPWCVGHRETETADDLEMHTGRTVEVQLPVGRAGSRRMDSTPAYFEVNRASAIDEGEGFTIRLHLETLVAPWEVHDFADALRNFADYLEINARVI